MQDAWLMAEGIHEFIIAILLTLATSFLLWLFRAKVKVIYGSTSNNYHQFKLSSEGQVISVWTEKFYVQNIGKAHASNIEIVFSSKPSGFNLWSPRTHSSETLENGNFVISVPSLAASDLLIVDMIDVEMNGPKLLAVNCPDAIAQEVEFQPIRQFGKVFYTLILYLMIAGLIGTFYLALSLAT